MTATDRAARVLPTGTVTFLFSDIEGSTRLLHELGEAMRGAGAAPTRAARGVRGPRGVEFGTEGDSFFVAFARASERWRRRPRGSAGWREARRGCAWACIRASRRRPPSGYLGARRSIARRASRRRVTAARCCCRRRWRRSGRLLARRRPLRDLGRAPAQGPCRARTRLSGRPPASCGTSFPPLRSLEATPNNLPQQVTSFIGREQRVGRGASALLARPALLTLTGSGGSGKTRLASRSPPTSLEQFPDGVWLVELAPLADPALVPQTVATVLGVREEPGKPFGQTLTEHLKDKRLLLLLDNCEHLLDACAQLADALLRQCPQLTFSRAAGRRSASRGEQTYRVPSLSLPDPKQAQTPADARAVRGGAAVHRPGAARRARISR